MTYDFERWFLLLAKLKNIASKRLTYPAFIWQRCPLLLVANFLWSRTKLIQFWKKKLKKKHNAPLIWLLWTFIITQTELFLTSFSISIIIIAQRHFSSTKKRPWKHLIETKSLNPTHPKSLCTNNYAFAWFFIRQVGIFTTDCRVSN